MSFLSFINEANTSSKIEHEVQGSGMVFYDIAYKFGNINLYVTASIDFIESTETKITTERRHLVIDDVNLGKDLEAALTTLYGKGFNKEKTSDEFKNKIYDEIVKYNKKNTSQLHKELSAVE